MRRVHSRGAALLDAPVSGSVPQVRAGTLAIMVGGDERAYALVEPILRELCTPTHIGENGQVLVLKLAISSASPYRCSPSPRACCWPNAPGSTASARST